VIARIKYMVNRKKILMLLTLFIGYVLIFCC